MTRRLALALTLSGSALVATGAAAQTVDQSNLAGTVTPVTTEPGLTAVPMTAAAASIAVDEPSAGSTGDDWNVSFTPYLWVAGTKGNIAIPRGSGDGVEIDKSFADILGNLNFAFMGALDIEHNRFVAIGDIMYLSVSAKAEGIQNPAFLTGKVDASVFVGTTMLGYRVVDKGPLFVDLLVGGRLTSIDVDLKLEGPLQTRRASASPSNVTPLIGGRVRFPLGEKWGLALYTDVGSLFDNADVKWQVVGTVQRDLGKHWRMAAGYRYMSINHTKNDMDFDVSLSGPILGFTYKF